MIPTMAIKVAALKGSVSARVGSRYFDQSVIRFENLSAPATIGIIPYVNFKRI
ncbi:hypothetical protein D3C81_1997910 [compost metagenome]